jgi:phosphoenolpyruvate carboxylase
MLKILTREQTISVVRAFSYFSHLANIAEDQHHIRRRRAHLLAGSNPQQGSVNFALASWRRRRQADTVRETFFQEALIAPVLTAHPTEVQRKSILDAEHDIARLLAERDLPLTPKERPPICNAARAHRHAVADPHAALLQADRGRRDRQRAVLLPHHLPARTAGLYDDIEGEIAASTASAEQPASTSALCADGQLDRRRPRRQSRTSMPAPCSTR